MGDLYIGSKVFTQPVVHENTVAFHKNATFRQGIATGSALGGQPPAVATPAVPAASANLANNTGYDVMVYVSGGTAVAVSVNGAATGLAAGGFYLPAGGTISLGAYTAAPTWLWQAV